MISSDRIGHNGCRIGIDQSDLYSFFPEGPGCLRTGVIKFTGLTYDDWTAANDENR